MATYFEYPSRGDVYAVDATQEALGTSAFVRIPGGGLVELSLRPGYFPEAVVGILRYQAKVWNARLVFKREEAEREYKGSWTPFIELLNAAAAVNTLFAVILTPEEYARLKSGGLERLKKRLSARAASLLRLCAPDEVWHETGGKPTLELLRTGRCP